MKPASVKVANVKTSKTLNIDGRNNTEMQLNKTGAMKEL